MDSAPAADGSKLNSLKISVVNVWYRRTSNAPYSEMTVSTTSTPPPTTAREMSGRLTLTKVANGPAPRLREVSSMAGSARRSAAATGR